MSDPIAHMLTKIRNASQARHGAVDIKFSKLKVGIAEVLKSEGYIVEYEVVSESDFPTQKIRITLKYNNEVPIINEIKRISKPGRRVYTKYNNMGRVRNGYGTFIVSTSQGIVTDREAREKKIGGELICSIW